MSIPSLTSTRPGSAARRTRPSRARRASSVLAHGEPSVWATGGALAIAIAMIGGLLLLVLIQGAATFWPHALVQIRTVDGKVYLGEVTREETYRPDATVFAALPADVREQAEHAVAENGGIARRQLLRVGNFELTGLRHVWISDFQVAEESTPEWALVIERLANGNFYGTPRAFLVDGQVTASEPEAIWAEFNTYHGEVLARLHEQIRIKRDDIGANDKEVEDARLALVEAKTHGEDSPEYARAAEHAQEVKAQIQQKDAELNKQIAALQKENDRFQMQLVTAGGQEKTLPLDQIVRAYPANRLGFWQNLGVYLSRWWEFLSDRPRESNTEGGVFPAIWGTVAMTLLLSLAVVPFGVLAALYLREYAKSGPIISAVRIAINNLAGVPSIVFGVFGYGFFCLLVGGYIDGGPQHIGVTVWPASTPEGGVGTWWLALFLSAALGLVAFLTGIGGSVAGRKAGWRLWLRRLSLVLWLACLGGFILLVIHSPYFHGFYRVKFPTPTFGSGGVLWAALTLALLTLPVVIVATEEALAAVPNSMREGSYACGASKWQTIRRIVLPRALPGIMTGMILAMARGAGEVAPLMLVGAVKSAPDLPGIFPLEQLSRRFMHLGFHIYDLGFQSPDSESARPMVYTTTLLLIAIVALLNLTAMWLRYRLRRRYAVSQF